MGNVVTIFQSLVSFFCESRQVANRFFMPIACFNYPISLILEVGTLAARVKKTHPFCYMDSQKVLSSLLRTYAKIGKKTHRLLVSKLCRQLF